MLEDFVPFGVGYVELPEGMNVEMDIESMDIEFEFVGEGEILWNLEAGVLHSLEVSGEMTQIIDMVMNMGGQSMENSMTQSGSHTSSITTSLD